MHMSNLSTMDRVKELTTKLEAGLKELVDSGKFKAFLDCMSKFHSYSFNNTMLILMQRPDATYVAGYQSWQRNFNRHVKAGEKGIQILAPSPYKKKVEQAKLDASGRIVKDHKGNSVMEEVEITIPAFKPVTVFDVAQTDGEPIPELVGNLDADVEAYISLKEALIDIAKVPVSFEEINGGAKGYFSPSEQKIVVQKDMPQTQTIKTLIHEIAHSELHDKTKPEPEEKKDRNTKEVEAESVAYTVCAHFHINTDDYSFGYIAGWSKSLDFPEFKKSLDTIQKCANQLIGKIEGRLYEKEHEKKQEKSSIQNKLKSGKEKASKQEITKRKKAKTHEKDNL